MKLNLGLSLREKYEALLQWHDHFALTPVRVGSSEHRWLETVERRGKGWSLCKSIRKHGADAHSYMVLEIVRGKAQAHARETALINDLQPRLNTFGVR